MTKRNLISRVKLPSLLALCVWIIFFSVSSYARTTECSFTVKPFAVCEISFYKLLATPKKYNNKYIAVTGYVAISDGRLAVYPTEMSYKFSIEQDSFSIQIPMKERESLAKNVNRHYVRIVGLFHYQIVGDRPGIGYISKLVDALLVGPRPDVPEDHYLKGLPQTR